MFTGGLVEEQQELVEIHSISEAILSILVDFIYTGNVDITQDNVQELFAAADMLELDEVVSSCISHLQQQFYFSSALGSDRWTFCTEIRNVFKVMWQSEIANSFLVTASSTWGDK